MTASAGIAERVGSDEEPEADPLGGLGHGCQRRVALEDRLVRVAEDGLGCDPTSRRGRSRAARRAVPPQGTPASRWPGSTSRDPELQVGHGAVLRIHEIECMHSIAAMIECQKPSVFERRSRGRSPMIWTVGGGLDENHLKLPALAIVAVLVVAACGSGPRRRGRRPWPRCAAAASASARGTERPAAPTPEPAKDCAQSADAGAMQMWERSGGNKGMVDILVCDWNAANPAKPINLTYIVHTEMVAKIAQGIASGEVPDLMGMDLIYAPQFEDAGQLVDITDQIEDWPELADREPRPHDRRDLQRPALRRAAVRRRVGAVLQQGPVHARPGSTRTSRRPASPSSAPTPTRSRRSAATPRATTCPATAPAATSSRSVR